MLWIFGLNVTSAIIVLTPSEANDSKYSKYYQRIRRAIRKEDEATRAAGGTIDWGYMLWNLDW